MDSIIVDLHYCTVLYINLLSVGVGRGTLRGPTRDTLEFMPPHNIATEPGSAPDGMEVIADDDAKAVFSVLLIWWRDSTRNVPGQFGSGLRGYTIVFWIGCCGESENTVPSKRPLQTVELSEVRWADTLMIQIQTVIFHIKILSSLYSTKHAGALPRS